MTHCETRLIHVWDMTHSCVRHDSFMCETWLHMCYMTNSCVWHNSFMCETWLVVHEPSSNVTWVMSRTQISQVTHLNTSCRTHEYLAQTRVTPRSLSEHCLESVLQCVAECCRMLSQCVTQIRVTPRSLSEHCLEITNEYESVKSQQNSNEYKSVTNQQSSWIERKRAIPK